MRTADYQYFQHIYEDAEPLEAVTSALVVLTSHLGDSDADEWLRARAHAALDRLVKAGEQTP